MFYGLCLLRAKKCKYATFSVARHVNIFLRIGLEVFWKRIDTCILSETMMLAQLKCRY